MPKIDQKRRQKLQKSRNEKAKKKEKRRQGQGLNERARNAAEKENRGFGEAKCERSFAAQPPIPENNLEKIKKQH